MRLSYKLIKAIQALFIASLCICFACQTNNSHQAPSQTNQGTNECFLVVLGTVQDGGSPHAGCIKACCKNLFVKPDPNRMVTSLGIVDRVNKKYWLLEASPDMSRQLKLLNTEAGFNHDEIPDGLFITHAHIGHYAGLMYLGREAMNTKEAEVYAMPRLLDFIRNNGPWSQLLSLENIHLNQLKADSEIVLSSQITLVPFKVRHRDEFSETVGYKISGPNKRVLFIPDIDKWEKWDRNIEDEIKKVDEVFIDGTFYDSKEINNRNINEIPHPFVIETMEMFSKLSTNEKKKIHFIHFNHSNQLLVNESDEMKTVLQNGFKVSKLFEQIQL